jgi:hypothetical protein
MGPLKSKHHNKIFTKLKMFTNIVHYDCKDHCKNFVQFATYYTTAF